MNAFKYAIAGAAFALAPIAAQAATLLSDGGSYTIGMAENEFAGPVMSTADGAGSWSVTFTSDTDPLESGALATIGGINLSEFTDLTVAWVDTSNAVLDSEVVGVGSTTLDTTFTVPNLTQSLVFTWSDSTAGFGFDVEVSAVPIPAAGLLLLTALGGGFALRRRKTAA